ncbi:unnamed protein product [Boreogadus saida]
MGTQHTAPPANWLLSDWGSAGIGKSRIGDLPTSGQSHVPDNGHWHTLRNHAPNLATTRTSSCCVDAW